MFMGFKEELRNTQAERVAGLYYDLLSSQVPPPPVSNEDDSSVFRKEMEKTYKSYPLLRGIEEETVDLIARLVAKGVSEETVGGIALGMHMACVAIGIYAESEIEEAEVI